MSMADGARQLAASLVTAGRQRLELAALDVQEELLRAGICIAGMLAVSVLATVALVGVSAALVLTFWDRAGVASLWLIAGLLGAATWALAARLARTLRTRPPFLGATLQELGRDADALRRPS